MDLIYIRNIFPVVLPKKYSLSSVLSSSISRLSFPYSSLLQNIGLIKYFPLRFRCKANHFLLLFNNKSKANLPSISSSFVFLCQTNYLLVISG